MFLKRFKAITILTCMCFIFMLLAKENKINNNEENTYSFQIVKSVNAASSALNTTDDDKSEIKIKQDAYSTSKLILKTTEMSFNGAEIVIKNKKEEAKKLKFEEEQKKFDEGEAEREAKRQQEEIYKLCEDGEKGMYQNYAYSFFDDYNWTVYDFKCLINLWNRESGWNPLAENPSSGAYGIPQSLPASKMESEGDDYRVNYETQIKWGIKYIANRYGNPANAWEHSNRTNWY